MEEHTRSDDVVAGLGWGTERASGASATRRERWRQIIAQQRESGIGVSAFCRQRSIQAGTFYAWRQRLAGARAASAVKTGDFVSVKLAVPCRASGGSPSASTSRSSSAGVAPAIEIRLRGGRRVLVRSGFDPRLLLELIGALEGTK